MRNFSHVLYAGCVESNSQPVTYESDALTRSYTIHPLHQI